MRGRAGIIYLFRGCGKTEHAYVMGDSDQERGRKGVREMYQERSLGLKNHCPFSLESSMYR